MFELFTDGIMWKAVSICWMFFSCFYRTSDVSPQSQMASSDAFKVRHSTCVLLETKNLKRLRWCRIKHPPKEQIRFTSILYGEEESSQMPQYIMAKCQMSHQKTKRISNEFTPGNKIFNIYDIEYTKLEIATIFFQEIYRKSAKLWT